MRKQLLTMLLMMVGMTSLAQSGWSDPSGNYQEQTVVYVTVDCGDYDIYSGVTVPQVAAFIGDEIRALATPYKETIGNYKVFILRVGGESTDERDDFGSSRIRSRALSCASTTIPMCVSQHALIPMPRQPRMLRDSPYRSSWIEWQSHPIIYHRV